jgi:membrane protease subunit HflK
MSKKHPHTPGENEPKPAASASPEIGTPAKMPVPTEETAHVPDAEPMEDAGAQALSEALGSSFKIIKVLMVGLVAVFIVSGIFTVNPNQVAMVLRFGKPVGLGSEQLLKPGLHWAFPRPIDEIVKIPVGQSHTVVSTAGWFATNPGDEAAGIKPPDLPSLQPGVQGYTVTGDGNIIHARATLKYRLEPNAAADYAFKYSDVTGVITNILNNALFYASARFTADGAIFTDRIRFQDLVAQRVNQLLLERQMGLILPADSLQVETSAPINVLPAFDDVTKAFQEAGQRKSEAEGYARSAINTALGQAQVVRADAITRSNQLVRTVAADADSFTSQLPFYLKNPQLYMERLRIETIQRVLTNAQETYFIPNRVDGKTRELRLQLSRQPQKPIAREPGQ